MRTIENLIEDIEFAKNLEYNWDGRRGNPIDDNVIILANKLAKAISKYKIPFVRPCSDGSLEFWWKTPKTELEITIRTDGYMSCYLYRPLAATDAPAILSIFDPGIEEICNILRKNL